jgi:hypothetical protein
MSPGQIDAAVVRSGHDVPEYTSALDALGTLGVLSPDFLRLINDGLDDFAEFASHIER